MTDQEKATVRVFLARAQERIDQQPGRVPFNTKEGNMVLGWLRALLVE